MSSLYVKHYVNMIYFYHVRTPDKIKFMILDLNTDIFMLFFRSRHMRTPTNKLLISLTLADFLLLFMCHSLTIQNVTGRGPVLGTIGCDIYGTVASIAALAEIWSLALISIDRFQAIFHPLENEKRMNAAEV